MRAFWGWSSLSSPAVAPTIQPFSAPWVVVARWRAGYCFTIQATLVFAFGLFWSWRVPTPLTVGLFGAWLAIIIGSLLTGFVVVCTFPFPRSMKQSLPFVALLGGVVTQFLLTVVKLFTAWTLEVIFLTLMIVVAVLLVGVRKHSAWPTVGRREAKAQVLATLLSLIAATVWTQHHYPLVQVEGGSQVYRPYQEMFYHAMRTSPLATDGNPRSIGSYQFSGERLTMYHYASYAYSALVSKWSGQALWVTTSTVWHPLGLLWLGWGAYSLARFWTGPRGALWATVAIAIIPDLYLWGFDAGTVMFSFHRFLEASPGLAYGCAAAAAVVVTLLAGLQQRSSALVTLAFSLLLALVLFKVNVFLPTFPLVGALLFYWRRRFFAGRWLFALWLAAAIGGGIVYLQIPGRPTIEPGFDLGVGVFENMLSAGSSMSARMERWALAPTVPGWCVRMGLVLGLVMGPFLLPLIALLVWPVSRATPPRRSSFVVIASLAICLGMLSFMAPNRNGDPYELSHRQFAWCYFVVLSWVMATLATRWQSFLPRSYVLEGVVSFVLVIWSALLTSMGGLQLDYTEFPSGFVECCDSIRQRSTPTDVVVSSDGDPRWRVGALTEQPMFVCTSPDDIIPGGAEFRPVLLERRERVEDLLSTTTAEGVIQWAERYGVRWVLIFPDVRVAWPAAMAEAPAIRHGACRVYDLAEFSRVVREPPGD